MSMAAPTLSSRSRARQAADEIFSSIDQRIADGRLMPGERLQPERELAEQFGASRAVVRAALLSLVSAGRISRHVGRGSFVADPLKTNGAAPSIFPDIAPAEMMEFRSILEPSMIDLIMLNASNGDIDAILACVDEGDGATDHPGWNLLDDKFHRLLAAATHNRLIITLYDAFSAARQKAAWNRLKQQTMDQSRWRAFQAQHRAIAVALRHGDRDAAFNAARSHLMQVRANMLGYTMELRPLDEDQR